MVLAAVAFEMKLMAPAEQDPLEPSVTFRAVAFTSSSASPADAAEQGGHGMSLDGRFALVVGATGELGGGSPGSCRSAGLTCILRVGILGY